MIRTYGLHWHIDRVHWGWQKNIGSLRGALTRSTRAAPVEFREQRGIYALYANYDLVYVGQTGRAGDRLFQRLKAHRSDHLAERWNRFSWFGVRWVTLQDELAADAQGVHLELDHALNILEAVSIAVSEPRLNLQRGRWGDNVEQYYQVEPAEGGPD